MTENEDDIRERIAEATPPNHVLLEWASSLILSTREAITSAVSAYFEPLRWMARVLVRRRYRSVPS